MIWFFIILLIVFTICFYYANIYNLFQTLIIKINEAENKIDITIRERYDLLVNATSFIKEKIDVEIMIDLKNLQQEELSSFDLERKLVALSKEFYESKYKYKNLSKIEDFIKIEFELKENEASLDGYIEYYNENITKYNKLIKVLFSNLIAKIHKLKIKNYYDGKNLEDKKINDFKL